MSKKKKYAVFTIDVECFSDTGCVQNARVTPECEMLDGLDEYIRLLEKFDIKATMFLVCNAAEALKTKVAEYNARGHRIALHGYDHTAPLTMDKEDFVERTRLAKEKLEKMFGVKVEGFRAPFFSLDDGKLDVIRQLGFTYDASYNGGASARHTGKWTLDGFKRLFSNVFVRQKFYEFGLACDNVMGRLMPICGGGYARLIHWFVLKPLLRRYMRKNDYYVFYVHPFELSREKMPKIKGLKGYDRYYLSQGISGYPKRIISIIKMLQKEGFAFVTFEDLAGIINSQTAKTN